MSNTQDMLSDQESSLRLQLVNIAQIHPGHSSVFHFLFPTIHHFVTLPPLISAILLVNYFAFELVALGACRLRVFLVAGRIQSIALADPRINDQL